MMVNAWSLLYEEMNGTMDETYPIREDIPDNLWGKPVVGGGNTASSIFESPDGGKPFINALLGEVNELMLILKKSGRE